MMWEQYHTMQTACWRRRLLAVGSSTLHCSGWCQTV